MRVMRLTAVAIVALAAACGGGSSDYTTGTGGGNNNPPPANQVYMQNSVFNPTSLSVAAGATVTWTNQDAVTHTVTYSSGPDASFSATVAPGATFQHTFATAGTYQYYCTIHGAPGSGMHASVQAQ